MTDVKSKYSNSPPERQVVGVENVTFMVRLGKTGMHILCYLSWLCPVYGFSVLINIQVQNN
jgi:hypothetical protein